MISVENVSKAYHTKSGKRWVVSNASFTVKRGQSIGILGRNGSGKSTLLRLIAGVEIPTTGTVRREMSVSWPLAFSGGFQASLTGAENARFIARLYGTPIDKTLQMVSEFAELNEYFYMPVKTYSSGMMARLSFGISLAVNFDCYLIDEIIAVGDQRFRARCEVALRQRRKQGAMVLVSHDMGILKSYCDSAMILDQSTVTLYDKLDEAARIYAKL